MVLSCGCIAYPCMHTQQDKMAVGMGVVGMGLGQMHQNMYNEILRQSAQMQNMHSIQQAVNPNENKINKKLLLLRK